MKYLVSSVTQGGEAVLEGGAPETAYLSIGSDESCTVDNFMMGCMDPWVLIMMKQLQVTTVLVSILL